MGRKKKNAKRDFKERWGNVCIYCGGKFSIHELTIDHVVPKCQGGEDDESNYVVACEPCNLRKANDTLGHFLLKLGYIHK